MKHGKFEAKGPVPKQEKQAGGGEFLKKKTVEPDGDAPKQHWWKGQLRLTRHLLILLPLMLALGAALFQLSWMMLTVPESTKQVGLTKEQTLEKFRNLARELEQTDMTLTLFPNDSASHDMPIVLTVPPERSRVRVDLAGLEQDLENGVGSLGRGLYWVDPANYISVDRAALRTMAERLERDWAQPYLPSFAGVTEQTVGDQQAELLTVNIGKRGREIYADEIYQTLIAAYHAGNLRPTRSYVTHIPQPLNVEEICQRYTVPPVDAVLDEQTYLITPEIPGIGVVPEELTKVLAYAHEGNGYVIPMRTLTPAVTTADIEAVLYENVLAEAHTPHVWDDDRTTNLMLACAALDGTVIMPGQVFSFNETVGERTEEKGYREATAYIAGASVPEVGGGVCQVASSIYYATLQADLPSVERHEHTYLVTYVPQGMDAAIYWNRLDFRFQNTSPYPIKLEASVADGDVHIYLRGKEWKNYTVELSYEILEETPWEVEERAVYDDSYETGDTIVSPYTGYLVATYKSIYNEKGNLTETVQIALSRYAKRNKVVAVRVWTTEPDD